MGQGLKRARAAARATQKPKSEPKKGESYRRGYMAGVDETAKAYGGCTKCYGKGYATTLEFSEGSEDFGGEDTSRRQLPIIRPCTCARGKQLDRLLLAVQGRKATVVV